MSDSLSIAGSALTAFSLKQSVTAGNIANMYTPGYSAQETVMQNRREGGVTAGVVTGSDRVDISRETTTMLGTTAGFKANAAVVKTAREMDRELFSIKA